MKYVCPAVTLGVRREARFSPVAFVQASSLHPAAISGPLAQVPLRRQSTVSKVVPAPQVWMVAVPETAGVHWKTCSGAVPEAPQLPASAFVPLVVPPKVPPWAGRTVGLLQSPASA